MSQILLLVRDPLEVGMGSRTIATIGTAIVKAAVDELLFRIVTEDSSLLLEASLNSCHAGKCHTGATVMLILYWANPACRELAVKM